MTDRGSAQPGPVRLTENSRVTFRPASHGSISGGLWAERRRVNRDVSVPEGWDHLHEAGNFHNLELAAGSTTGCVRRDDSDIEAMLLLWYDGVVVVVVHHSYVLFTGSVRIADSCGKIISPTCGNLNIVDILEAIRYRADHIILEVT